MNISRRRFCQATSALAAVVPDPFSIATAQETASPKITLPKTGPLETFVWCRAIIHGAQNHWFGYYDKREFDPTSKLVLANQLPWVRFATHGYFL